MANKVSHTDFSPAYSSPVGNDPAHVGMPAEQEGLVPQLPLEINDIAMSYLHPNDRDNLSEPGSPCKRAIDRYEITFHEGSLHEREAALCKLRQIRRELICPYEDARKAAYVRREEALHSGLVDMDPRVLSIIDAFCEDELPEEIRTYFYLQLSAPLGEALVSAAEEGLLGIVRELLERVPLDGSTHYSLSVVLNEATRTGRLRVVQEFLVDRPLNQLPPSGLENALLIAAGAGNLGVMQEFLEHKLFGTISNESLSRMLEIAVDNNRYAIVEEFLARVPHEKFIHEDSKDVLERALKMVGATSSLPS